MSAGLEKLRGLIRLCHRNALKDGIPLAPACVQVLLAAVGVAGARLSWKPPGAPVPRFGRASVTFLGADGESFPGWFLRGILPITAAQRQTRETARSWLRPKPSPQEIRHRRQQVAMIQSWMPVVTRMMTREYAGPRDYNAEFLIEIDSRVRRPPGKPNGFGDDRFAILYGEPAYRALHRPTTMARLVREAALHEGRGLRITPHGWVPRHAFFRLCRTEAVEAVRDFGWLLPAGRPPMVPGESWLPEDILSPAYREALDLRFLEPVKHYQPPRDIADLLGDPGSDIPSWCRQEHLLPLLRTDEELAWQLAALLTMMAGRENLCVEDHHLVVEMVLEICRWIGGNHQQEVRLLFPAPPRIHQIHCPAGSRID